MAGYGALTRQSRPYPYANIKCQAHVLRPGQKRSIPHADKFYFNIDREGFLECVALVPPSFILASEHLVCEGNLLVVPRREQAHLRPIELGSTEA